MRGNYDSQNVQLKAKHLYTATFGERAGTAFDPLLRHACGFKLAKAAVDSRRHRKKIAQTKRERPSAASIPPAHFISNSEFGALTSCCFSSPENLRVTAMSRTNSGLPQHRAVRQGCPGGAKMGRFQCQSVPLSKECHARCSRIQCQSVPRETIGNCVNTL